MFIIQPRIATGDRPGIGVWRCLACNWRVEIREHHAPLPPCGGTCQKDPAIDETQACYQRVRGIVLEPTPPTP